LTAPAARRDAETTAECARGRPAPERTGGNAGESAVDKSRGAVREMFAGVAPRYDLLNHLLSGALDFVWRRRAAAALGLGGGARVLDLCSGTGDQAVAVARRGPRVAAADFCLPMLTRSRRKFAALERAGGGRGRAAPLAADALALPFPPGSFDGATVSFGLRNVEDLDAGLRALAAALRLGGRLAVLEFALPENRLLRGLYLFYFRRLLPAIGRLLSPRGSAYSYLPASVLEFPQRRGLTERLERAGFTDAGWRDLAGGTVCLYTATRGG
jgi:demethylmenaquinone methyltransferase/2-methoxy-6-polyprenyl-1,4-benzoquinol methylase